MLKTLKAPLLALQRRLTRTFGTDISTPRARRAAWWHFQLVDYAFLRLWWKNLDQVGPGVWRSNQPAPADMEHLAKAGLKSVLNLRGRSAQGFWLFEAETCDRLGITLHDLPLSARNPPSRDQMLQLITLLGTIQHPFLIHCKSGADRTGLAAAVWQMVMLGHSADQAMRQISWRYLHVSRSDAGVQDQILRSFATEGESKGQKFEDWVQTHYDPNRIRADFARWRAQQ
jgi:protein tyrosine phosphatase (PTP) superfamily phosphohydrolase (DUF442 family)